MNEAEWQQQVVDRGRRHRRQDMTGWARIGIRKAHLWEPYDDPQITEGRWMRAACGCGYATTFAPGDQPEDVSVCCRNCLRLAVRRGRT